MRLPSPTQRLAAAGCVYAEEEAAILVETCRTAGELEAMVARREAGEPLEYIVGWTSFRGIRFAVDAGLFVPRPRSELLVAEASSLVRHLAASGRAAVVVDLCCGIGAIGGALADQLPQVELHAADVDPRAVACATRNLTRWGAKVHHGDLFHALPSRLRARVDVVVASPPYVPTEEISFLPSEARRFEPSIALDGGAEGLDVVGRIALGARDWLSPEGGLALELGVSQLDRAEQMLTDLGYVTRAATTEEDRAAVVVGRLPR